MDEHGIPMGLGFALAQHPSAMRRFSELSETERDEILRKAHNAMSKKDMQNIVRNLSAEN